MVWVVSCGEEEGEGFRLSRGRVLCFQLGFLSLGGRFKTIDRVKHGRALRGFQGFLFVSFLENFCFFVQPRCVLMKFPQDPIIHFH